MTVTLDDLKHLPRIDLKSKNSEYPLKIFEEAYIELKNILRDNSKIYVIGVTFTGNNNHVPTLLWSAGKENGKCTNMNTSPIFNLVKYEAV